MKVGGRRLEERRKKEEDGGKMEEGVRTEENDKRGARA